MRSAGLIRAIKRIDIVISILLCAIGLWMAFMPDLTLRTIGVIIGIVLGVTGVVKLIGYYFFFLHFFEHDIMFSSKMRVREIYMHFYEER